MEFKYIDSRGLLLTMTVTIIPLFGLYFFYNFLSIIKMDRWSNAEVRTFSICMILSIFLNIYITAYIIGWLI